MKKNRMMRLASLLLVCVLLTTSVISGTFAKYISEATGTSTATVAKWSFNVGADNNITTTKTFNVDLFSTAYELTAGNVGTEEETDVKADGALIAPGTGGSFKLSMQNTSEVTAKYTITLSGIETAGVPLQFSVDNKNWFNAADALNSEYISVSATLAIGATATDSAPIYWRWVFDGDDIVDTDLGLNPVSPTVTVKVVAEQVD